MFRRSRFSQICRRYHSATIDGTTQPGWSGTPIVEINGNNLFQAFNIASGGSTIRGLAINRVGGNAAASAIFINGGAGPAFTGSNIIEGNYFGIDPTGMQVRPQPRPITISNSPNNRIGGTTAAARNVIGGSTQQGITVLGAGSTGNIIQGNYIGLNAAGTAALPNSGQAVSIGASGNTVGTPGAGNVISGNSTGIGIQSGGSGNIVKANLIGTDAAGTAAIPNGIAINLSGGAANNVIGGTTAADRNVISGNGQGVFIQNSGTTGNLLQGNYIGVNPAGTAALANTGAGVILQGAASGNTIGGSVAGAGNVISGNQGAGILVQSGANGNAIKGNLIGTNPSGSAAILNSSFGINVLSTASTVIGGTTATERNVISGNTAGGVQISGAASTSTIVIGNFIGTNAAGRRSGRQQRPGGVRVTGGATGTQIGGTAPELRQRHLGQHAAGVRIDSAGTSNNVVAGNYIGLNLAGTSAVRNGADGVLDRRRPRRTTRSAGQPPAPAT